MGFMGLFTGGAGFDQVSDYPDLFELDHVALTIKCKLCGSVSHHPQDIEYRYCARCHLFLDDIWPPCRQWCIDHPQHVMRHPGPFLKEIKL